MAGADVQINSISISSQPSSLLIDDVHIRSANTVDIKAHSIRFSLRDAPSNSLVPEVDVTLSEPTIIASPGAPHQITPASLPLPQFLLRRIHSIQVENGKLDLRTQAANLTAKNVSGNIMPSATNGDGTTSFPFDVVVTGIFRATRGNDMELLCPVTLHASAAVSPDSGTFHLLQATTQSQSAELTTHSGNIQLTMDAGIATNENGSNQIQIHVKAIAFSGSTQLPVETQHALTTTFPIVLDATGIEHDSGNWDLTFTGATSQKGFTLQGKTTITPNFSIIGDIQTTLNTEVAPPFFDLFLPKSFNVNSTGTMKTTVHAEFSHHIETTTTLSFEDVTTQLTQTAATGLPVHTRTTINGALTVRTKDTTVSDLHGNLSLEGDVKLQGSSPLFHHSTTLSLTPSEDSASFVVSGQTNYTYSDATLRIRTADLNFTLFPKTINEWRAEFMSTMSRWSLFEGKRAINMPLVTMSGHAQSSADQTIRISDMRVEGKGLLKATGSATLSLAPQISGTGILDISIPIDGLYRIANASLAQSAPTSFQSTGQLQGQLQLDIADSSPIIVMSLSGKNLGIQSQDNLLIAQGVGVQTTSRFSQEQGFSTAIALASGEVLYDQYYVNMTQLPLQLSAKYSPNSQTGTATMRLGNILETTASIQQEKQHSFREANISIKHADVSPLFRLLLRDPFSSSNPILGQTNISGQLSGQVAIKKRNSGIMTSGQITLSQNEIHIEKDGDSLFDLRQGHLDLPFSYAFGDTGSIHVSPAAGRFTANLGPSFAGASGPIDIGIQLAPGKLLLTPQKSESFSIALKGVLGQLGPIEIKNPLSSTPIATTRANVEANLSTYSMKDIRLSGNLQGHFSQITLSPQSLRCQGDVTGTFFGGNLTVNNLFVQSPLRQDRIFGANMSLTGLDLEAISEATGIGHITGRLNINLDNITVSHGEPVTFILRAESPNKATTSRSISLKAVNAISILGTGSSITDAGANLFMGVFKEFSYSRIGILCALKNDIFTIRGLIHDNAVEYLVKRGLTGINVVNANPNNTIGFHDMAERVARVVTPPHLEP